MQASPRGDHQRAEEPHIGQVPAAQGASTSRLFKETGALGVDPVLKCVASQHFEKQLLYHAESVFRALARVMILWWPGFFSCACSAELSHQDGKPCSTFVALCYLACTGIPHQTVRSAKRHATSNHLVCKGTSSQTI
eukprot:1105942-Pelagomonas_calceolata.AAC.1